MVSDYKKMLELKQDDWINACREIDKLTEKVKALEKQLKKAEECLSWYADDKNQIAPIYIPTGNPGADFTQPYRMDKGRRARNYFKEKEGN